nr:MAG TPA: hypothetical protein [Crassvirales sp.]
MYIFYKISYLHFSNYRIYYLKFHLNISYLLSSAF